MGHKEKKAYLAAIRKRYRKGNKELKSRILDEFCAVCKYHRKYASNLLWQPFANSGPNRSTIPVQTDR